MNDIDYVPDSCLDPDPLRAQPISNLRLTRMPEFQLPGLLVTSSVVWLISEPHIGKTFVMLDLALALASGQEFLGIAPTKRQRTMAFFLDSPAWAMRSQLEALVAGRQLDLAQLDDWFMYRTRPTGGRLDLKNAQDVENIVESLTYNHADVCMLDCFSKVMSGNENVREEMEVVMDTVALIGQRAGVTMIVSDHVPAMARERDSTNQARGSTVKGADADTSWMLRNMSRGRKSLTVVKARGTKSAGTVYTFKFADTNGGTTIALKNVQSREEVENKRDTMEQRILEWSMPEGVVKDMVDRVMELEMAPDRDRAESAVRNALTRLRKRGLIERLGKNRWARTDEDAE